MLQDVICQQQCKAGCRVTDSDDSIVCWSRDQTSGCWDVAERSVFVGDQNTFPFFEVHPAAASSNSPPLSVSDESELDSSWSVPTSEASSVDSEASSVSASESTEEDEEPSSQSECMMMSRASCDKWQHSNGRPVTRDDLLMTLADLDSISLRTIYDSHMVSVALSDIMSSCNTVHDTNRVIN
ncbi:hypothetical protein F7725_001431 [Dissostichus mawsoni]|uniref:Laminin IV type A domain-containing protein n=1 Tax=Dissostichus mawsoni TaxID=36200 RepID=A0A7J5ZHS6_DISMA|nr:hypothetical protein F7725_001431 [Dissostichus mawsoni]